MYETIFLLNYRTGYWHKKWPVQGEPSSSAKDQQAKALAKEEHFA